MYNLGTQFRNKFKGILAYKTRCSLNPNVPSTYSSLEATPCGSAALRVVKQNAKVPLCSMFIQRPVKENLCSNKWRFLRAPEHEAQHLLSRVT